MARKKLKAGTFKIIENWEIKTINRHTKKILQKEKISNLIVNDGLNLIRNWMAGDSVNNPQKLAIGTGTTSPTNNDSTLETEYTRETATITKPADYQVKYAKTFTFGSGVEEDITEAGLFESDGSGSIMTARTTFSAKSVSPDINLIVEATLTVSRV